jgi:hypothetical protein
VTDASVLGSTRHPVRGITAGGVSLRGLGDMSHMRCHRTALISSPNSGVFDAIRLRPSRAHTCSAVGARSRRGAQARPRRSQRRLLSRERTLRYLSPAVPSSTPVGVGGQTSSFVTACPTVHPGAMEGSPTGNMVAFGAGNGRLGPSHSESPELAMVPLAATVAFPSCWQRRTPSLGVDRLYSRP